MLVRALKLKDALSLYQEHFLQLGKMDNTDCLTTADWNEIKDLIKLLESLAKSSKLTQLVLLE